MDPLVGQCSEVSYTKLLLLNFEWTVDDFFRLNFCLSCNLCEYFTEKEANDWSIFYLLLDIFRIEHKLCFYN